MFKNLTPYRAAFTGPVDPAELAAVQFTPTLPTQAMSIGWVPPRGEHQALVEVFGGERILAARIETRSVPWRRSPVIACSQATRL